MLNSKIFISVKEATTMFISLFMHLLNFSFSMNGTAEDLSSLDDQTVTKKLENTIRPTDTKENLNITKEMSSSEHLTNNHSKGYDSDQEMASEGDDNLIIDNENEDEQLSEEDIDEDVLLKDDDETGNSKETISSSENDTEIRDSSSNNFEKSEGIVKGNDSKIASNAIKKLTNGVNSDVPENSSDIEMSETTEGEENAEQCDISSANLTEDESREKRVVEQKRKIACYKEELLCEEATLNLLRKLIESQRGKLGYKVSSRQNNIPSLHPKQPQQIAPKGPLPSKNNPQPPKTNQPIQKYYIQVGNQLVPAPAPGSGNSGNQQYHYSNGVNASTNYQPVPPKAVQPPKQTPEQKQNAAKAALRRQLEQTLLQIPPPRPPPADWRAIPNVNSMDFMMLVGLDEVVDNILDADKKPTLKSALEELMPYNPRICSQCEVDFSPCWKNKEGDANGYVVCERCALQNIKKDLKAEHTSRLKSAFLKALKQEQEIEEKIKAGEDVNISSLTSNEKENRNTPSPQQTRVSSPRQNVQPLNQQSSGSNHAPSPTERHGSSHHRHQVIQHYPHHTSLVQQLHHQHIQQQQLELEPTQRHNNSRWHPYVKSPHHRDSHHSSHHRPYVPVSSNTPVNEGSPHQEFYLVHHPSSVRYISR